DQRRLSVFFIQQPLHGRNQPAPAYGRELIPCLECIHLVFEFHLQALHADPVKRFPVLHPVHALYSLVVLSNAFPLAWYFLNRAAVRTNCFSSAQSPEGS